MACFHRRDSTLGDSMDQIQLRLLSTTTGIFSVEEMGGHVRGSPMEGGVIGINVTGVERLNEILAESRINKDAARPAELFQQLLFLFLIY
eukprot:g20437.t1